MRTHPHTHLLPTQPCRIFMQPEDVQFMFSEMVQRSEQLFFSPVESSDSHLFHLPIFLEALASITGVMDQVCLSVCLSVCLFVCLSVCLSVCLLVCLSVSLSVCWSVCLPDCLPVSFSLYTYMNLSVNLPLSCSKSCLVALQGENNQSCQCCVRVRAECLM